MDLQINLEGRRIWLEQRIERLFIFEGWNDTRTVESTSTNSSRFTVVNDALEQGFALVTSIGLSIDLLLSRCGTTCIVALPVVSYFISPLLGRREGWFIGNGDASSTCLDRKYGELDSQSRPLPSRHSPTRRRRRRRRRIISLMKSLSWIIRARVVDTCVFVRPSLKRSLL